MNGQFSLFFDMIDSRETYEKWYRESLDSPDTFWSKIAQNFVWENRWNKVKGEEDFRQGKISWFDGAELNITVNCLDRYLDGRGDQVALIWEGNDPKDTQKFTYLELHQKVCQYGNALRDLGIGKGDRVCLYMPMIPELMICMLACARIGAVHNVIFGGFSGDSIRQRIEDCGAKLVITANEGWRGEKTIPLKSIIDEALSSGCESVEGVLVFRHTKTDVPMQDGRDDFADDLITDLYIGPCEPEMVGAEDPLFILYTSGSTGKPKGVMHTAAGYMIYAATTFQIAFDIRDKDIFWCTADVGWITGHSYLVYGPLLNGTTTVMFEGVPTYPTPSRLWEIIQKNHITHFYTAPTLLRMLVKLGDQYLQGYDLSSLRILGSVGEPISPETWNWFHDKVGGGRCPIIDTYWQTETGGFVICPFPNAFPLKPGSAGRPFFGIDAVVVDGHLLFRHSWPGMMRGVYHHPELFKEKYFTNFPGFYETGDSAMIDEDGDFHLLGRIDDVLKVAGHRIGTAEVESALVSHPAVSESAVVGKPDEVKGESIFAFVVLKDGFTASPELAKELTDHVGTHVGAIAKPSEIRFVEGVPKTRSGKIMRRILRKIAAGQKDFGDTATLANPEILEKLLA